MSPSWLPKLGFILSLAVPASLCAMEAPAKYVQRGASKPPVAGQKIPSTPPCENAIPVGARLHTLKNITSQGRCTAIAPKDTPTPPPPATKRGAMKHLIGK